MLATNEWCETKEECSKQRTTRENSHGKKYVGAAYDMNELEFQHLITLLALYQKLKSS
jgi:hypothetical protein